jgi:hypothetical protein
VQDAPALVALSFVQEANSAVLFIDQNQRIAAHVGTCGGGVAIVKFVHG